MGRTKQKPGGKLSKKKRKSIKGKAKYSQLPALKKKKSSKELHREKGGKKVPAADEEDGEWNLTEEVEREQTGTDSSEEYQGLEEAVEESLAPAEQSKAPTSQSLSITPAELRLPYRIYILPQKPLPPPRGGMTVEEWTNDCERWIRKAYQDLRLTKKSLSKITATEIYWNFTQQGTLATLITIGTPSSIVSSSSSGE